MGTPPPGARENPTIDLPFVLRRCREGDSLAWEALVRQYQSRIYGIAFHYAGNREDARDLAQEIFVRVYRNLASCADAGMFVPWIIRISRNACIDYLRRRKARAHGRDVAIEEIRNLPAAGGNPEQESEANSRTRLLHRALAELSELNREIIHLKEIQGLQLEEIAAMLKVPLGTIKSRSNRARIELAKKVLAIGGE
jgi:RNA polymerase sigma-70 factor (ECF subfamily)